MMIVNRNETMKFQFDGENNNNNNEKQNVTCTSWWFDDNHLT